MTSIAKKHNYAFERELVTIARKVFEEGELS
jgi:hypothetical protein